MVWWKTGPTISDSWRVLIQRTTGHCPKCWMVPSAQPAQVKNPFYQNSVVSYRHQQTRSLDSRSHKDSRHREFLLTWLRDDLAAPVSQVSSVSKLGRGSQLGVRSGLKFPSRTKPAGAVGGGEGGRWSKSLEGQKATISQHTRGSQPAPEGHSNNSKPCPYGGQGRGTFSKASKQKQMVSQKILPQWHKSRSVWLLASAVPVQGVLPGTSPTKSPFRDLAASDAVGTAHLSDQGEGGSLQTVISDLGSKRLHICILGGPQAVTRVTTGQERAGQPSRGRCTRLLPPTPPHHPPRKLAMQGRTDSWVSSSRSAEPRVRMTSEWHCLMGAPLPGPPPAQTSAWASGGHTEMPEGQLPRTAGS